MNAPRWDNQHILYHLEWNTLVAMHNLFRFGYFFQGMSRCWSLTMAVIFSYIYIYMVLLSRNCNKQRQLKTHDHINLCHNRAQAFEEHNQYAKGLYQRCSAIKQITYWSERRFCLVFEKKSNNNPSKLSLSAQETIARGRNMTLSFHKNLNMDHVAMYIKNLKFKKNIFF